MLPERSNVSLAMPVHSFADASAHPQRLRDAEAVCRAACLPDWPEHEHLRPGSPDVVLVAAEEVLAAVQQMLRPLEGQHVHGEQREGLHEAQAYAVSALDTHIGGLIHFDVQKRVAEDQKPLLVCYGERWRQIQTAKAGLEWFRVKGGDGCGLVYRGLLGKANANGERRCIACCPTCNGQRMRRAANHVARVRQVYDFGFVSYPKFDTTGAVVAKVWIGRCHRCGDFVETTDLRKHRCERCRQRHR